MVAALIDYSQLIGNANGTTPEVEATSKALRVTPKPQELGSLGGGAYGVSSLPGLNQTTLGAVTLTNSIIYSFRWSGKQSIARVRRVTLSWGWGAAGTAGVFTFNMKIARRFLVQYNAGLLADYGPLTGGLISTLRTSHSQPTTEVNAVQTTSAVTSNLFSEIVYLTASGGGGADTGTEGLAGATNVIDTNPIASISVSRPATAGTTALKPFALWDVADGDAPLDLSAQEGFVIQVTTPSLGTSPSLIGLSVVTLFDEIPLTLI